MAKLHIQMQAERREGTGKGAARAVRRNNRVPAVIYGAGQPPVSISLEERPITLEYQKGRLFTALCDLDVGGEKHLVIPRDLQRDPVSNRILHADFLRVTEKTIISVAIPVRFTGHDDCPALAAGATLVVSHHDVPLLCPASAIPDQIDVDLTGQPVGHAFKLLDVALPDGCRHDVHDPEQFTIATLAAPRVEEEIPAEAPESVEVPASEQAAEEAAAPADGKKDEEK